MRADRRNIYACARDRQSQDAPRQRRWRRGGSRGAPYVARANDKLKSRKRWLAWLDVMVVAMLALSILAIGFAESDYAHNFFKHFPSEYALTLLTVAITARL